MHYFSPYGSEGNTNRFKLIMFTRIAPTDEEMSVSPGCNGRKLFHSTSLDDIGRVQKHSKVAIHILYTPYLFPYFKSVIMLLIICLSSSVHGSLIMDSNMMPHKKISSQKYDHCNATVSLQCLCILHALLIFILEREVHY